jgi:SAM-dependent methyltransferase
MSATVSKRNTCRLCDHPHLSKVVDLCPIPLAEKYTSNSNERDASTYPVDLYMCNNCGHVQLLDIIESETLWDDYTYHSGQTKGIVKHFQEVTRSIIKGNKPQEGSLIIDIGSNDGSLLRPFKDMGYKVLGIDPAREIARKATESGIETIPRLFTQNVSSEIKQKYGEADVITAFNVFAHAENMHEIASGIRKLLSPNGVFIFEVQYLVDIIDKMLLGTIFHEHMSHHSIIPLSKFLKYHGMEIIDLERNNIQHGSIIGTAQLIGGQKKTKGVVEEILSQERKRGLDQPKALDPFLSKLKIMEETFDQLKKGWQKSNARVAAYGAARSGPTFIAQFGLSKTIECIFDDHPQKVGMYSPKDHIKIFPTSVLYDMLPEYTIILAWIHGDKIVKKNIDYLEKGGHFVLCYPEVKVVGINDLN